MQRATIVITSVLLVACHSYAAEVAFVKATFSLQEHPGQGIDTFYDVVKRGLDQNAVEYDIVTDEQIVEGALADYRLAIFPFMLDTTPEHTQAILDYVADGGNLMWMYTVPAALEETLGIAEITYRRNEYEGQLHTMDFTEDAPPGFPEEVRQESKSARVVTELTGDARVIADWLDAEGKSTDTPAVIMTDHSVYVAHVFWHDADAAAQHHLLLATIAHFVPGTWQTVIEGAISGATVDTDYADFDALVADLRDHPNAGTPAQQAAELAADARAALADEQYADALAMAGQVATTAQRAVAARFPSRPCEMRGGWMGFPRDDMDWDEIMSELEAANFTAVFPLMCTPGAYAYPSDVLPQVTERDHLTECIEAAHAHGIEVHPWRANWQVIRAAEGVVDQFYEDGRFVLSVEQAMGQEERDQRYVWSRRWLDPSDERNRQLEIDAMEEMAREFDVDGIHYDFMRYPGSRYCYCDRCREKFEEWADLKIEDWPADCWEGGKHLAAFRDWRRHLQTSLVAEMRERLAAIDPEVQISLAARASVTGAPESDAQDWITWAREGYLDFLCPMNYTGEVDVFRRKLEPQMELVGGTIPVYAGIGVAPYRSDTPVNLSHQIALARELGADGFLIYALGGFAREMLPAVAGGSTARPVDRMPHHLQ
ncbi:MAG: family 10 glycosylhydrolase, partial [Armatimonadia bacterium]|nr:family 10 glycosylhydrolase [Armatimonadia bacterium]